MRRVLGDAAQDIGQPGLRIHVVHFSCDDDAEHGGSSLTAAIRGEVIMPGSRRRKSPSAIRFILLSGKLSFWPVCISTAAPNTFSCGGATERHSFFPRGHHKAAISLRLPMSSNPASSKGWGQMVTP